MKKQLQTMLCVGKQLAFVAILPVLVCACFVSNAQISNYSRVVLSGLTYTQIPGGTVINSNGQLTGLGLNDDDGGLAVNLPFTFTYDNVGYTQVTFCTNGWIGMGNQTSLTAGQGRAGGSLFTTTVPNLTLGAWFGDGSANWTSGGGSMVHGSIGTDIYAFEWRNASGSSFNNSATIRINFMIVLYGPTTATPGRIEYLYGGTTGVITTGRTIGIENAVGGTGNYKNAINGLSNSTTTAAAWPGNGNGYRFDPATLITLQPTSVTICSGTSTSFSVAATWTATGYQWQESTNGGTTWNNLANGGVYGGVTTTTLALTAVPPNMNDYRYRCFVLGNGNPTSNAVILAVNAAPIASVNPLPQTVCEGTGTSFTVATTTLGSTYQWQENQGTGFINLSNTGIYSGVTTTTLTLSGSTTAMNGYQYRCMLSFCCGPNCFAGSSTYALLTVQYKPAVSTHPVSITQCSGTNAAFEVTGIGTGLGYQWQESTNGGTTWANMVNAGVYSNVTTSKLALTGIPITMHNYQYRCVLTGTCAPNATSNAAVLSVYDNPTITIQPGSPAICAGTNTTFSVTTTGSGQSYQWQVNTGLGFSNLSNTGVYSNVTTNTMTITGALSTMDQYQYRCVISTGCNSGVQSNAGILTILQLPAVTQQPVARTLCEGGNTSFTVIGSGAGSGYQWQESTNGGTTWANIIGGGIYSNVTAGTMNLTGVPATMNSYQYRCVITGTCAPNANSNAALLTVNTVPVITSNPGNRTVCVGGTAPFSVTATGTGLTFQWQVNQGGSGFTNISNGGFYSNVTTANLSVSGATTILNGAEYRCIVSGTCAGPATSTGGILTVNAPVAITASPVNATVCTNGYTGFNVTATGTGLTYQWQESTNGGVTWNNLTNNAIYGLVNNANMTISLPPATMNNYRYRCLVMGTCTPAGVLSGFGILTVNSIPGITAQSTTSVTQCAGTNTVMSVTGTGTSITYQWQESQNGGLTWNNLVNGAPYLNVTTATMTLSATPVTLNGFQYRCIVTGICAPPIQSMPVSLTVNSLPAVTLQPISSTLCLGGNTSFTVNATGTGIQYQWQLSINSGGTWTNLIDNFQYAGSTSTTLNVTGVTAAMTNYYYRCRITGVCSPAVNSSSAILTVQTPPSLTSQPVDRTLCSGGGTTFATSATGTSVVYQWQVSQNGGSSWTNLANGAPYSNATTATLTVSPVAATMDGYLYRCYVTGTCTPPVTTFVAKLTVWTAPTIVSQTTSVQACPGVPTTMSVNVTGSNLVYQWQMNSGFGFIAVPTGSIYSGMNTGVLSLSGPSALQNGYLFRCIISGSCGSPATSATIPLTVYKPVDIVYSPATANVCVGGSQYIAIKALGNNLVYQWQEKVGGVYINLQNVAPYSNTTLDTMWITDAQDTMNGKIFRCLVTEYTLCNQLYPSGEVTLTVAAPTQTDPVSQTISKWGVAYFKVPMGGLYYQWQEDQGGGNGFVDLTEVSPYLGIHTATLRINPLSETMSGYKYRCIVDGICVTRTTTLPATLMVTPGTSVAQQQGKELNYMSVYPNPVSGNSLQVKFDKSVKGTTLVKILDKLGREVYSSRLELEQGTTGQVSVGELAAGVYTLQVVNEQETINSSVRFTKQ